MSKATSGAANGTAMQQQAGQQVQAAAGGQPDYSKQWAEYYRNIGKIEEAEAIENQMKAAKVMKQKEIVLSIKIIDSNFTFCNESCCRFEVYQLSLDRFYF